VEGNTVGTIQSLGIGNTFSVSTPALATFDAQGNFTGTLPDVVHGDVQTTFLGGNDSVGSSFGIQTQRIVSATTANELKTFPAGSYVIPVSGTLTNHANLHAMLALETLGKRNLGNSYVRFTPGLHSAEIASTDLAQEWPYPYRAHYLPVETGSKFPAYRYMNADLETVLKMERVYTIQPFINGANFAAGYPVNLSILKGKGFNIGKISKVNMGYYFKAEGTVLTGLNPKAGQFYVTVPTKFDDATLEKWYLYNWSTKEFVEAVPGVSARSGAKTVTVASAYINEDSDVVLISASTATSDLSKLPFPDLNSLQDKDVTVDACQDIISGKVAVKITNPGLTDGELVTFYFVDRNGKFISLSKVVKEVKSGVFEAIFTPAELAALENGTKYAVQYSNADGTVKGFSTFNKGGFTYRDGICEDSEGCNAGLAYGTMGFLAVLLFVRRKSK
jgi:hypothetical protein